MKGRSQAEQDQWVLEQTRNLTRPKTFLEIGACNGLDFSNTWLLEQQGDWTGLLVEPHIGMFHELVENRPSCRHSNDVIDDDVREVQFWERVGWISGIVDSDTDQGLARNLQQRREAKQRGLIRTRKTKTLVQLLQEHEMPLVIDYFSLDVEGAEHRILTEDVLENYSFNLLTVERPKVVLRERLAKYDYVQVGRRADLDTYYRNAYFPVDPK